MTANFGQLACELWHASHIDQYPLAADSNNVIFIASLQAGLAHVAEAISAGKAMSYIFLSQLDISSRASLLQE